ncbi:MAG: hypothetical protein HZA54_00200 [Planctomycetes bacterium]|nr:hypothetical protein [Planctomycetota bacterium]
MTALAVVTDPKHLPKIVHLIHDCWFGVEDIRFDSDRQVMAIPFSRGSRRLGDSGYGRSRTLPPPDCVLKVHHVVGHSVIDHELVGFYDFTELTYNSGDRRIDVRTGIPIAIHAVVDSFEVSVEQLGQDDQV